MIKIKKQLNLNFRPDSLLHPENHPEKDGQGSSSQCVTGKPEADPRRNCLNAWEKSQYHQGALGQA